MSAASNPATVDGCLRLGTGFSQHEWSRIVDQFAPLDARLAAFHADGTDLELSVKDRESRGQKVTLECTVAGRHRIVATSPEEQLKDALNDVRDDVRRQLDDAKTRREPRNNRRLRETGIPAPAPEGDALIPSGDDESAADESADALR